ncbi:hypothetical protein F503_05059 [Ophiostoma piceae UAMH 11346]|uniref:Uncharacterized protein n=1 Tax=Ophiostoma piceae (strain UAMH 11346) TaxID=1262450 RepID=S3C8X7_OPHP1|nr:hypothetical protein F503_05059 [Ophiostoma piceae UAMH 11346]
MHKWWRSDTTNSHRAQEWEVIRLCHIANFLEEELAANAAEKAAEAGLAAATAATAATTGAGAAEDAAPVDAILETLPESGCGRPSFGWKVYRWPEQPRVSFDG